MSAALVDFNRVGWIRPYRCSRYHSFESGRPVCDFKPKTHHGKAGGTDVPESAKCPDCLWRLHLRKRRSNS